MHRASNAFNVLQAVAAIVSIAIIFWSLGLPSFRFVEAANVTSFSNTLSTSRPNVAANHTIVFTTPTGILDGESITIDFSDGPFGIGSVDYTDIDIAAPADLAVAADCSGAEPVGASFTGTTLTLQFCAGNGGEVDPDGTVTIRIGTHAVDGNAQLVNPDVPAEGSSYEIKLTAGQDVGETRVAILDTVQVTAAVDTFFDFEVSGVDGGEMVNGTTTTGSTNATAIPFGELKAGIASTAAQELRVITNSRNGFTVTVVADGMLESATGADIDGFIAGAYTSSPTAWVAPVPVVGNEWTYGHWGLTSDSTNSDGSSPLFPAQQYVSPSTTPVTVFTHNGPTDGNTTGQGTTRVGYTVQISPLQEAATDYEATLTYVATPVF
jgi:hypothetical protein